MRFVDTNVLLYAVSRLPEDAAKRARARELLKEPELALSVQIIQEFYYQATRRGGLTHEQALSTLEPYLMFPMQPVTLEVFRDAASISQRYRVSYWDGAVLAAAAKMGCDTIYTEDLNAGQQYGSVRALNPFADLMQAS